MKALLWRLLHRQRVEQPAGDAEAFAATLGLMEYAAKAFSVKHECFLCGTAWEAPRFELYRHRCDGELPLRLLR